MHIDGNGRTAPGLSRVDTYGPACGLHPGSAAGSGHGDAARRTGPDVSPDDVGRSAGTAGAPLGGVATCPWRKPPDGGPAGGC